MSEFQETRTVFQGNTQWGQTSGPEDLLHRIFERQASLAPDQIALICGKFQMTYGELDRRSNQLARHLRSLGVERGSCVGLWLPRSIEVYVALLGILKSGAAYVPIDPDYPVDRVNFILEDCKVAAVITCSDFAGRANRPGEPRCVRAEPSGAPPAILIDREWSLILQNSAEPLPEFGNEPADLCYVIYTSGSTGRPKGVMIEHRSATHLVEAEAALFGVKANDRVFQGFSIAFDASVEEIWLAFRAGATLVVGTKEMMQAGPGLAALLEKAGVTVWSTVPTLLATQEQDAPSVRLLISGGEACSPDLVRRWCKPGRRMVNTYGPTEATVIATCGDCAPDKAVTIGRALPGYLVYLLDGELQPTPPGQSGEIFIGGIGVARGYVNRPELTREKFIPNPFLKETSAAPRLYRTGDLGLVNERGEIEFLGRIDDQVKIRGFRVELTEIESVLIECSGVRSAAVAVREDTPGVQQLIGYVLARDGVLDEPKLREQLRQRLPAFMVPGVIEQLSELPLLPSGKVDRKRLPKPSTRTEPLQDAQPRTEMERKLLALWSELFQPAPVSLDDDFFFDLGGHSLLAAKLVSELRKDPVCAGISMRDVYGHPTIARLAARFPGKPQSNTADAFHPPSKLAHFFCGAAQFISLYFVLGFGAMQWLAPYLTYTWMIEEDYSIAQAVAAAFSALVIVYPIMLVLAVALKWLIIGRYKAGQYPLWGFFYFRFWLANSFQSVVPIGYLAGTPLLNVFYRLLGANIGKNVLLNEDAFGAADLVVVGDDTSIGSDTHLSGYSVENGLLTIGSLSIGRGCFVGTRAVAGPNTVLDDGARLEDLSLLPQGITIPKGETWAGSPAAKIKANLSPDENSKLRRAEDSPPFHLLFALLHTVGLLLFPVLVAAAIFPGIIVMNELNYLDDYYWYLFVAPGVGLSFVVLLALEIAGLKWLLLGRVKAGAYPVKSWFYVRKWFVDQTMNLSLDVIGTLYGSVYLAPWYRLLGAKLGRRAEISTDERIVFQHGAGREQGTVADERALANAILRYGHDSPVHARRAE